MSKNRRGKRASTSTKVTSATSGGVPDDELLADGSGPSSAEADQPIEVAGADAAPTPDGEVAEELAASDVLEVDDADHADHAAAGSSPELRLAPDLEATAVGDEPIDEHDASADADADAEADGQGDAAELPTSATSMDDVQLKQLVEALVFASDKPVTVQRLRQLTRVSEVRRLEQALTELTADYEHRGLVLHQVSGGYQFRTRPQFSVWVQQLIAGRPVRLSRAQLETLAIVAYRQPITRPEIDDIRGVDSSATLKLLMDRALIRVLGKKEEVGRPMLYGTTKDFLDFFSLGDLRELPTLREYSELSDESRRVITARLGAEPDDGDGGQGDGGDGGSEPGGGGEGGGDGGGGGPIGDNGPMGDDGASDGASQGVAVEARSVDDASADPGGEQLEPTDQVEALAAVAAIDAPADDDAADDDAETGVHAEPPSAEDDETVVRIAAADTEAAHDEDTSTVTIVEVADLERSELGVVDPMIAAEAIRAETSPGDGPRETSE